MKQQKNNNSTRTYLIVLLSVQESPKKGRFCSSQWLRHCTNSPLSSLKNRFIYRKQNILEAMVDFCTSFSDDGGSKQQNIVYFSTARCPLPGSMKVIRRFQFPANNC